ncbi:MAG: aspartate carbamoyltransferase catalytic subunit [Anaerosomatales bacterium]|uniref:aspartate carbamoyltransferase catalytic subunit n=1 Tax=Parvivirga hydrogeniphila TaxID=2939460 RepID=UPI002260D34C|nr:aspartate carbamoyltransferase catalytic subunit [Parvivirga hydrogeniphila]MCL4079684.1 aspartate carbamoyltransferase catalytic subunit [Parvivirga hydrogeniphila]MDI6693136.1 aspartate carbamoyltransferase catalytic subunit [Anaerosomatales bacterium]
MLSCTHILTMDDLTPDDIALILDTADSFAEVNERRIKKLPTLRGRTIVNLFFEPSTRTRTSFEIAAKRLSADGVNFSASASATAKGESLRDTAKTLSAMACDLVVVRHRYAGAPQVLAECMDAHIVNGGDGIHQHPTQALLDLFTMRRALGRLEGITVGIVGDIAHSRVAGSLVPALRMVGARPILVGPKTLMPARPDVLGAEVAYSLDEVLPELDVAYMLRVQFERDAAMPIPSVREYARLYGMNAARLARAKPEMIVMHPGPMNRGVEISSDVADSPRSVVLDQVNAGVAVRMAVMYLLLGGEGSGAAA